MSTIPHWTAYVTAIVMPVIAIIATWIAFRQSQIARNKLKLELFEMRMQVYEIVRETLGIAVSHGKLTPEQEFKYLSGTRPAKWLFGPDVAEYLDVTLWRNIVDFNMHNELSKGSDEERSNHIHARADILKWFGLQFREFDDLCAAYLKLTH